MKQIYKQKTKANIKICFCGQLTHKRDESDWGDGEKILGDRSKQILYFNTHLKVNTSYAIEAFLRNTYPTVVVAYAQNWTSRKLFKFFKPFMILGTKKRKY